MNIETSRLQIRMNYVLPAMAFLTLMQTPAFGQNPGRLSVNYSSSAQIYSNFDVNGYFAGFAYSGISAYYNGSYHSPTLPDYGLCPPSSPCATVHYAVSVAPEGGYIRIDNPGMFTWLEGYTGYSQGALNIGQAVTIDATGVAEPCPFPIVVTAGPNDVVVLRGFRFNNFTGTPITVVSGNVRVEDFKVTGSTDRAIWVQGGKAVVTNSVIDSTVNGIYAFGTGSLMVDNVTFTNNSQYGLLLNGTAPFGFMTATVRNSSFTGNGQAIFVNTNGILTLENSILAQNTFAIGTWAGVARVSNATITDNGTAFSTLSGGSIVSFVNNRIYGNSNNGAATVSAYQK